MLINNLEAQQADIRNGGTSYSPSATSIAKNQDLLSKKDEIDNKIVDSRKELVNAEEALATREEIENALKAVRNSIFGKNLRETTEAERLHENLYIYLNENYLANLQDDIKEVAAELEKDEDFKAAVLAEALTTSIPTKVKYIETKPNKDALVVPTFGARSAIAYGSTEIERKDIKDRRYNQPLIMTIKFKERFSDGKFSDNELTAVIGILGKVIRIPSEELKYILKANAEGETITGFFKNGGDLNNLVSDLLSTNKLNKDIKNLPQSAEVWKNLEKVATLAASNKLAGKKTNNIANTHIVLSQKEVDEVRTEEGIDYLKNMKLTYNLMKRYSAFSVMIANDPGQRVYIYDDPDAISWNVVPYSALMGKDNGDQLVAALSRLGRM